MSNSLDLSMDKLQDIESPLSDMEWGIIGGAAFAAGIAIGIAVT